MEPIHMFFVGKWSSSHSRLLKPGVGSADWLKRLVSLWDPKGGSPAPELDLGRGDWMTALAERGHVQC